jgi:DNA-binding transcriptional regulator YhcF (GntR family)
VIDPDSDRAVYRQIADDLRELITTEHIGPGRLLPSSRRLEQEYGVSRETIRGALNVLRQEGLVVTESGYGTRVREPEVRVMVPVPRGATVISRPATPDERAEHDITEGGWVLVVSLGGRERGTYAADRTELRFS